ncbi:DUF4153 domain-containing protein [Butyrivibrio sp. WCD3002]|uniref:DUF4153 domain-containing protein n=1 Tax=Butyrivibrio sp. WCD3002 TaxID=1280676 RepID=UPI00042438F5|nr:DUF4173 domain-containing protein [Butyrivibrio sp. WCD3002]
MENNMNQDEILLKEEVNSQQEVLADGTYGKVLANGATPIFSGSEPAINPAQVVPIEEKGDDVSFRKYALLSIIYAIVHTYCLYRNTDAITYPVSMVVTLILIGIARRRDGFSLIADKNGDKRLGIFYVISLTLLSISKFLTANTTLLWIDGFAITVLMFSFMLHLYADTKGWDIFSWAIGIMATLLRPISCIADPFYDTHCWLSKRKDGDKPKNKNLPAVIAGLCIAVPLLFVVVALLASADLVFSNMLEHILDLIELPENIEDYFGITLMLVWSLLLFYTVFRSLSKGKAGAHEARNIGINPVVAITFTSLLSAVYLLFSVIQIVYLFMGNMTLPEKYTYAEYAHEGFYQLLAVSIMNFVIVMTCKRLFSENTILKVILTIIGACTYIMIASSAFRMFMYIDVYHLTFLRVFVLWFLAVLAVCLAYLIFYLYADRFPIYNACMVTVTVMYLAFVFANPDYHIAKYDMNYLNKAVDTREYSGTVEYYLMYEISPDAVPAYVGNERLLSEYYLLDGDDTYKEENQHIRNFNYSRNRAYKLKNHK